MKETKTSEPPPIACTLTGNNFQKRLAWISELTRDALQSYERHDLVLDLKYAAAAAERVREMVLKEKACCAFLTFDLHEDHREIRLTITAPEAAREAANALFQQFVASGGGFVAAASLGLSTYEMGAASSQQYKGLNFPLPSDIYQCVTTLAHRKRFIHRRSASGDGKRREQSY